MPSLIFKDTCTAHAHSMQSMKGVCALRTLIVKNN